MLTGCTAIRSVDVSRISDMDRARQLRRILGRKALVTAMAAHNPLTGLLAEQAGFDAIWASGFELSASLGIPDAGIVSPGDHLEMTRRIVQRTAIPVIADIDTGYGNAVNAHYAVSRYVDAGAAAVVIEDKTFPKDTSLRKGGRQQLVATGEFVGKLRAALDARRDSELIIIARTEALVAGAGVEEALARARMYQSAGADMILVHSKECRTDELMDFIRQWRLSIPIVIVPTAFPQFGEAEALETGKIRMLIYGNHCVRAAVAGVRNAFARIRADHGAAGVEDVIASVGDIIELQDDAGMRRIETEFLR